MNDRITLDYGSGGSKTSELIESILLPAFNNDALASLGDGAVLSGSQELRRIPLEISRRRYRKTFCLRNRQRSVYGWGNTEISEPFFHIRRGIFLLRL